MNWWNISVFCIIPIVSVVFFFFWKRKYLWMAPLISTAISVVISLLAMPSILSDAEHRNMFFGISVCFIFDSSCIDGHCLCRGAFFS